MGINNPPNLSTLRAQVVDLILEAHHRSYYFPDDISKTVTLTAGVGDNDFGDWAEIADNLGAIFSDETIHDLGISAMQVRQESVADKLYLFEVGYGLAVDAVTNIDIHEFGSGTKFVDGDEVAWFRPPLVPAGQKIYYRMKCETGGATCQVIFRYHHHLEGGG